MRIFAETISLLEVPGEISLTLGVSGCPHKCPGCSWAEEDTAGDIVTIHGFSDKLEYFKGAVTVVTFLGGEWLDDIEEFLQVAKDKGFKTCLYTGLEHVDIDTTLLDYLKVGSWKQELGGLDAETTNQRFIKVESGDVLNHLFRS